ncbi:MAG: EVE domain-containing protein [Ignavibacteriaceae bacterium]|jgi:predicted RNA-binding protein with PUA-like domain|nr:EVE domain-containing protein [Ignavibacteriaceae bacterium]
MAVYWLFKSEPSVFSIDDLAKAKNQTTYWNGVRNYQARNFLRDSIKMGDKVLFYHSNAEPTAVVGICKVVREGYPDFTALDPDDDHYDPKDSPEKPVWYMVDIKLEKKFRRPVTLEELKQIPALKDFLLLKRGNRLSVFPVKKSEFDTLVKLGG